MSSYWTDRRVVVTGGSGFLGRHVVEQLEGLGAAEVLVPRRSDYDLRDETAVARMYAEMRPDVVLHLAGDVGGIGANQENPGRFFHSNLAMGMHLIEHARRNDIDKFVMVGTICSYPRDTPVPFEETDLWNGYPEETNAPYGIAKKALGVMLDAYHRQYGLRSAYVLPVNLYGPHDNFDPDSSHVIPAVIRKCTEARDAGSREIVCWGSGHPSREFLFVEDAARGILRAAERVHIPEPINLGNGEEHSIRTVVRLIADITGFEGRITWDSRKPDGQPRRCLSVARARELLEWSAETALDDGLRRTVDYWMRYVEQSRARPSRGPSDRARSCAA